MSKNNSSNPQQFHTSYIARIVVGVTLLLVVATGYTAQEQFEASTSSSGAVTAQEQLAQDEKALAYSFNKKNDKNRAADAFLHALKLAPQIFSYEEKIAVAKLLIILKRRNEAIALLQNTIKEPHQGVIAELVLANQLASSKDNQKDRTAEFYMHSVKLAPQLYNYDEKITIATSLVKLKRYHDAKALLQNMVSEPHHGFSAELLLAKLLASTGKYDAALGEANGILQRDQLNHGALLVKGQTLRRRKAFGDAIRAYRAVLKRADDFDARLGLVYCLLAIGHKQEAEKQFKLLYAEDEWQQYDLMELARNIDVNVRPVVEYMYSYFDDKEKYSGDEQDFTVKGNIADWDVSLSARHRTTDGAGIKATADKGIVYVGTNISESFHVFAGLGVCELSWQQQDTPAEKPLKPFYIGEFRMDAQIWNGTANFAYTVDALTANATLIQNVVGVKSSEVTYNLPVNAALTVKVKYRNSEYTDGKVANDDNTSQEFEGVTLLALNRGAPQFSVGYSYRDLNFQKPSTQGYFDPQDYKAHKLLFLAAYEHGAFYLYAEYIAGRQGYTRKDIDQGDTFHHEGITTGTTLWKGFRIEMSAEQNNSNTKNSDDIYSYGDASISVRLSYSL